MTIASSTLSGNVADYGGAIYNDQSLYIANSTISGNFAYDDGGGIDSAYYASIGGTIVANNTLYGGQNENCSLRDPYTPAYGTIYDQGYNLENGSDCFSPGTGSLQNADPKLGPLANNGGPTQTIALKLGSPAIDQIPTSDKALCQASGTDQRGYARPDAGETNCDIGAYESGASSPTSALVVQFTVHHLGTSLLAHWTVTQHTGIAGFLLYAGKHRLTRQPIVVRAVSSYRYRTRDTTLGPVILRVLLVTGRTFDVHPR